jgi:hypothetical protein
MDVLIVTVSLPFICDFESADMCQMEASSIGDFEWVRQMGSPTTLDTGPPGAESGSYYLLMNASYDHLPQDKAMYD